MSTLRDALLEVAGSRALLEAQSRGLRVIAKTSISPAVTVYDARAVDPGFLELLGVKTHIVAVDADGRVVAELGEPAPTDWPTAAVLWGVAALIGFLGVALLARAIR